MKLIDSLEGLAATFLGAPRLSLPPHHVALFVMIHRARQAVLPFAFCPPSCAEASGHEPQSPGHGRNAIPPGRLVCIGNWIKMRIRKNGQFNQTLDNKQFAEKPFPDNECEATASTASAIPNRLSPTQKLVARWAARSVRAQTKNSLGKQSVLDQDKGTPSWKFHAGKESLGKGKFGRTHSCYGRREKPNDSWPLIVVLQ